jgi:hypothetical protein
MAAPMFGTAPFEGRGCPPSLSTPSWQTRRQRRQGRERRSSGGPPGPTWAALGGGLLAGAAGKLTLFCLCLRICCGFFGVVLVKTKNWSKKGFVSLFFLFFIGAATRASNKHSEHRTVDDLYKCGHAGIIILFDFLSLKIKKVEICSRKESKQQARGEHKKKKRFGEKTMETFQLDEQMVF